MSPNGSEYSRPEIYWIERLARFGYIIKGVVYILIGGLALRAALNLAGGQITGLTGALQALLAQPFGQILLGIVVLGLGGYGVWFIVRAVFDIERDGRTLLGLIKRFSYGLNGVGHLGLTLIGVQLLIGMRAGSSADSPQSLARQLLAQPLGQWLVAFIALIIAGIALYNLYDAYQTKFCDSLDIEAMEEGLRVWATCFGRIGRVAQSIILMVIAFFALRAAFWVDPRQVQGLPGALTYLDQSAFGPWLLAAVSAGLMINGLFMFIEAHYHRIDPEGFTLINEVEEIVEEHRS